jgi:hypothetical protein
LLANKNVFPRSSTITHGRERFKIDESNSPWIPRK